MRFLVDECTGSKVARWLREQGYEVFSVYDEARGISDDYHKYSYTHFRYRYLELLPRFHGSRFHDSRFHDSHFHDSRFHDSRFHDSNIHTTLRLIAQLENIPANLQFCKISFPAHPVFFYNVS